jgi:putative ABC transport system substrate-binding protein
MGAAAMLRSTHSGAQQPSKTYLIGYLAPAEIPYVIKALKDGLRKLGYIEGHNLRVEYRFLPAEGASVDTLAAELVKLGPKVIITAGTAMTVAAQRATTTIPIVMAPVADPLRAGIVTSLAHPGGNVTGTMLYGLELDGKRVDVFNWDSPYEPPNQCEFLRFSSVLARQAGGADRCRNVDSSKRWVSS